MQLVPHERSLVQKFQDKPFALLGVNGDPDQETAKNVVVESKINWRSFWNGKDAKISTDWKLKGWPTIFIIDHNGVIRNKFVGVDKPEDLDKGVEKLLSDLEGEKVSFLSK
jgi:hypothetical protein